jgi:TRAP-type mannitol/chloroaromatic compound transport system permease small subunit
VRGVVSAFLFLPFTAGWVTAAVSVADAVFSGGEESDESGEAVGIFFAMVCVGRRLSVFVLEVAEVIGTGEVESGVEEWRE